MSLIINNLLPEDKLNKSKVKKTGKFNWAEYYFLNRNRIANKRAIKYREDEAYRLSIVEKSRVYNEKKRLERIAAGKESDRDPLYNISIIEAAAILEVTPWILRNWERRGLYPKPICLQGTHWVSKYQLDLLMPLRDYMDLHSGRIPKKEENNVKELISIVENINKNWNNEKTVDKIS